MIQNIGVIGAGQMGNGIAHVAALAGFDVKLYDVDAAQLDKAKETIEQNMGRQIKRGTIKEADREAALKRIATGQDFKMFADCDIVIEAAVEKEQIKKDIFKALCPVLKPGAMIATPLACDLTASANMFSKLNPNCTSTRIAISVAPASNRIALISCTHVVAIMPPRVT